MSASGPLGSPAKVSKRTCTYKTSLAVPATITFGSPVMSAAFAASQKAASQGVAVVTVHGLGKRGVGRQSRERPFCPQGNARHRDQRTESHRCRIGSLGAQDSLTR